jgi:histidine ammonia-lyase
VSMGPIAGRHARPVLEHVERIVGIELLCASRALDLRLAMLAGSSAGDGVAAAQALVRAVVPAWERDREPGPDLEAVTRLVHSGDLAALARPAGT